MNATPSISEPIPSHVPRMAPAEETAALMARQAEERGKNTPPSGTGSVIVSCSGKCQSCLHQICHEEGNS